MIVYYAFKDQLNAKLLNQILRMRLNSLACLRKMVVCNRFDFLGFTE